MTKIKIGFSRPHSWKPFAWLIMKTYDIPYSHVYVKFRSDSYDRDIIYQASKTMVNFMGTAVFLKENIIIDEFEVEISDERKISLMQFAIDNAGKPYGLLCALGMGIVRVCELFGKKIQNPFRDSEATYVCSELGGYILEQYTDAKIAPDMEDLTPKAVYEYLTALKNLNP